MPKNAPKAIVMLDDFVFVMLKVSSKFMIVSEVYDFCNDGHNNGIHYKLFCNFNG